MMGRIVHADETWETISRDNMILRGCQLRNTTFVEGIVLYAGNFCITLLLDFLKAYLFCFTLFDSNYCWKISPRLISSTANSFSFSFFNISL